MKFALINDSKVEATKGAKGICPSCSAELIAKCGQVKINHWAHKGARNCDPWWENETEWHRLWKNNFPRESQEICLIDEQTGEKHIADVRTSHGLTIEFQHSFINQQERISRESFYKNMIWVVDGTRLKKDYPRFIKGHGDFRMTNKQGIFLVDFPDECFPASWLGSSVPVIFDFLGIENANVRDMRNHLYCLFPKQNKRESVLAVMTREYLIQNCLNGRFLNKQHDPETQNQVSQQPVIRRRESPYVLERGRWVKRKRF